MAAKLPPRIKPLDNKNWYVLYSENGKPLRSSLRTKDRATAEVRFLGWLEQRQNNLIIDDDPTLNTCLKG